MCLFLKTDKNGQILTNTDKYRQWPRPSLYICRVITGKWHFVGRKVPLYGLQSGMLKGKKSVQQPKSQ